jgi:hypothetical protein
MHISKDRKISTQWPSATSQILEKQQVKSKPSRRSEIIKIRAEINEIETKNHTKN